MGSMYSDLDTPSNTNTVFSASVQEKSKYDDDDDEPDMSQSLALRSRHVNKDITYHKQLRLGKLPKFTLEQINEMRRVLRRKNMQMLRHQELQPVWVRMGMTEKYSKTAEVIENVAKMKQFASLNLKIVAHTNDFANAWVTSS